MPPKARAPDASSRGQVLERHHACRDVAARDDPLGCRAAALLDRAIASGTNGMSPRPGRSGTNAPRAALLAATAALQLRDAPFETRARGKGKPRRAFSE